MFAICEIAGKQHKVQKGDLVTIERLNHKEGDQVSTDKILLKADGSQVTLGTPYIKGARVDFTIKEHFKGPKIRVYKKKAKKRYERTIGHRQPYTKIEIIAIQ